MPPQKRGRNDKAKAKSSTAAAQRGEEDHGMHGRANAAHDDDDDDAHDDSDSESDDDSEEDALTFAEAMDEDEDEDDDDDDEDDDGDDAMDGAASEGRLVNVEFVFTDPREHHFHSVKQFLLSYLPSSHPLDVSGLADVIVKQVAAGTMVSVEGETDVYGFITALSLRRYADTTAIQQIVQYVTKRCPEAARLTTLLATKSVGLVINERMINLPYQLVPPLHSALHDDIEWAIQNEGTEELRSSFEFEYFLILSSCTIEKGGSVTTKSKKKQKAAKTEYAQTAKYYANFEDEFLEPEAELTFTFETPRGERDVGMHQKHTVVMVIERARHKAALASIAAMING